MRVLLLNQTFYPDVAATAQHAHDLAKHLVSQGHEVVVVASRSIYGQRGAVLPKREVVDGIDVRRVGMNLFNKGSIFVRAMDYAMFYVLALVKVFCLPKPDVTVAFTTPPFIALVGRLMRVLRGVPFVYWVMDLYPDLPVGCGVMKERGLVTRFFEGFNRYCLRKAERAVVLGECMRQRVLAKGTPARRLVHISVWADAKEIKPLPREGNPYRQRWGLDGEFVVMYSGNFGLGHDAATVCDAMYRLRDREDIRFVFVGGGKRLCEIKRFIAQRELTNVQIHPYQARELLDESLSLGDVHLISLSEPVTGAMVPSKLFGIMAAARPALFIGHPDSEVARVIHENDCGRTVRCGDGEGLARVIVEMAGDPQRCKAMGQRGREALINQYDRQHACEQWERLLLEYAPQKQEMVLATARES